MRAWKTGFPRKQLHERYASLIWPGKRFKFASFLQACYIHLKHKAPNIVVVEVKKDTQGVAKMLTELYARKLAGMNPEDVQGKDYYQANKLVIEEQKLSLDKNAQMLEFAKIFGIPEPIIQGEEEHAELGPSKDEGDKPTGS